MWRRDRSSLPCAIDPHERARACRLAARRHVHVHQRPVAGDAEIARTMTSSSPTAARRGPPARGSRASQIERYGPQRPRRDVDEVAAPNVVRVAAAPDEDRGRLRAEIECRDRRVIQSAGLRGDREEDRATARKDLRPEVIGFAAIVIRSRHDRRAPRRWPRRAAARYSDCWSRRQSCRQAARSRPAARRPVSPTGSTARRRWPPS